MQLGGALIWEGWRSKGNVTKTWQVSLDSQEVTGLEEYGDITQRELDKGKRQSPGWDLEDAHLVVRYGWGDT